MLLKISGMVLAIFLVIQCSVKAPEKAKNDCRIGAYELKKSRCVETDTASNIQKGIIQFNGMEINYQHGTNIPRGLQDSREYVEQSFRAYHYRKFFDYIHIDPKVHKLFRDSVKVESIQWIETGQNKECSACNVELSLRFRQKSIPYAIFITPTLLAELNRTQVVRKTTNDFEIKYFKNEETSGAFILPKVHTKESSGLLLELVKGTDDDFNAFIQNQIKYRKS